jgi:hypothetical protein
MTWLRNWINRAKQQPSDPEREPESAPGSDQRAGADEGHREGFHIRDAERRQLRRLIRRESDLLFDLERAEESLNDENRWTERIEQLNQAIEQAMADRQAIEPASDGQIRPQLDPVPVTVTELKESEPARITLAIGSVTITYAEEIDWAERGHQVTMPELKRVAGDVDELMPSLASSELQQELREHLRHSLSIYANQVLEHAANGEQHPPVTLADMTEPCPACGGWLDQKQRCPQCSELNWQRQKVDEDLRRIRKERDDVILDLERQRDRLPIIQRQLTETRSDIEKLRAKGVEPAE